MNDCTTTQAMSGARPATDGNNHSSGSTESSLTKTPCDAAPIFGLLSQPTVIPRNARTIKFDDTGKQVNLGGRPIRSVHEIAEKHRIRKEFLENRKKNRIKHISVQLNKSKRRMKLIAQNCARWQRELDELTGVKNEHGSKPSV